MAARPSKPRGQAFAPAKKGRAGKGRPAPKRAGKARAAALAAAPEALAPEAIPAARPEGPETLSLGRTLAALGLAACFAWGAYRTAQVKIREHLALETLAPLLPQGENPGNLSGVQAVKADGKGGIFTLSKSGGLWRVQHFGPQLDLMEHLDLQAAKVGELSDLAVLPDGRIWLATLDGGIWRLDPGLKLPRREAELEAGRSEIRTLDALPRGGLVALDTAGAALVYLDGQGSVQRVIPVKAASGVRSLTLVPEGLAWLETRGDAVWIRVLNLDGQTLRRFRVRGVNPAAPDRAASSGNVLIINDHGGSLGVVFYTAQGRRLGNSLGMGPHSVVNPGFVAGDPAGGIAYVHFGPGLIKVRLPWTEDKP